MKNFLLALIPHLTTKAAVTAAVCVVSTAAVTATTTGIIYSHKTAEYKDTIERLEAQQEENSGVAAGENKQAGSGQATDTAVRVVDGILEVWDGSQWVDYGSVDDVEASDPYRENDDRKEETERSVASKKLAELGLAINEKGEIVAADPEAANTVVTNNGITVLVGNNANAKNTNAATAATAANSGKGVAGVRNNAADARGESNTAVAGNTPEQVMAAIQSGMKTGTPAATQTISALPQSTSPSAGVTNVSWTASPDPYGGDDHDSGGNSGGGGGGGSSYSSSDSGGSSGGGGGGGGESSHEEHHEEHHEESHEESHDDSSSSSDSGGSSDSGSSSEGDGFSEDYL